MIAIRKTATIAGLCLFVAAPAAAQSVPAGSYACTADSGTRFGTLELRGGSYRGILLEPEGPFHPVKYGPGGAILFTAGLGAIEPVGVRYMGTEGSVGHRPWIRIDYKTPSGGVATMSCEREGA